MRNSPHQTLWLLLVWGCFVVSASLPAKEKPNVLVILADDLGYADIGCFGAKDIATPHLDRMAKEGVSLTSFYVSAVCSPTRAALMTGCIPQRVGIGGVMFPRNTHGLNPDETTLPELMRAQGYATALIGKWHLGNQDKFQPLNHGFDYWFGTPASNSQTFDPKIKQYAKDCVWREGYTRESILKMEQAKCPLVRNNVVIEVPADQPRLTRRYTEETIAFIKQSRDAGKPFFVYLPHNMPHIPLHASEKFVGSSQRGLYGDVIQELDWSTGKILKALKQFGLEKNTLVIFTSDNGPNLKFGGRATPFSGSKGDTREGGVRVPFIARWPGRIPANQKSDEPATVMDLLPTLVRLAGGQPPADRILDGKNIAPLLTSAPDARSPHDAVYYLRGRTFHGLRAGPWKYRNVRPKKSKTTQQELFNLHDDPGEQKNLVEQHPDIATRLRKQLAAFETEFRKNIRPTGTSE